MIWKHGKWIFSIFALNPFPETEKVRFYFGEHKFCLRRLSTNFCFLFSSWKNMLEELARPFVWNYRHVSVKVIYYYKSLDVSLEKPNQIKFKKVDKLIHVKILFVSETYL